MKDEIPDCQDKMQHLNELGKSLVNDPKVGREDSTNISKELRAANYKWENLVKTHNNRQNRCVWAH